MKIAFLNTYDNSGGAAIACLRLVEAIAASGHEVKMHVREKTISNPHVVDVNPGWQKYPGFFRYALEKLYFLPFEVSKDIRFHFSSANIGKDLSQLKSIQEADVIHLHWINHGFLSLKNIEKLVGLGKPIVWTLHDKWLFTGGCHITRDCYNYEDACGNCPYLKKPSSTDLSHKIWQNKKALLENSHIHFVTCSNWLKKLAIGSSLLKDKSVTRIPNPLDTNLYKPLAKKTVRQQLGLPEKAFLVLFVSANIASPFKGFKYLVEAFQMIKKEKPELFAKMKLVVVGRDKNKLIPSLDFPVIYLGEISNPADLIPVYNACDILAAPSIEDNLPNTVMESLACGVPVVGFETGGIPEMVDHLENGFIAPQKDVRALVQGMEWVFKLENNNTLSEKARLKVMAHYRYGVIAERYLELYRALG